MSKVGILYETRNSLNGKIYIGVRTLSGTYHDNHYLGSGKLLKAAIKKYGRENFTRKILVKSTPDYCYELESKIVNQDFVDRPDTYNICLGGIGGLRLPDGAERISKAQRKIWDQASLAFREDRKKFLKSIKPPEPKGKSSHHWQGYWLTPLGEFETCRGAAKAHNFKDSKVIRNRCKVNNDKIIIKQRKGLIPFDWVGKTWKELGWGFISKEVKDGE